jgi:hypothetical protein
MPFTEMYSTTIYEWKSYCKRVKVLLNTVDDGKDNSYWVDIRTHFNGEKCKPTKFGVYLLFDELEKLLPDMLEVKDCEESGKWRRVWFKKSDRGSLCDLNVRKFNGSESTIGLSHNDIKKINLIKDKKYLILLIILRFKI